MCSRPRTVRRRRPAPSSTRMCFDVELSEIGNALATSVTRASDSARRARMARRVTSETAEKTRSSVPAEYSPIEVNVAVAARDRKRHPRDRPDELGVSLTQHLDGRTHVGLRLPDCRFWRAWEGGFEASFCTPVQAPNPWLGEPDPNRASGRRTRRRRPHQPPNRRRRLSPSAPCRPMSRTSSPGSGCPPRAELAARAAAQRTAVSRFVTCRRGTCALTPRLRIARTLQRAEACGRSDR